MVNPKLFLSNYFDSLINQIDIHTEEQLEKYQENENLNEDLILFERNFNINKNDEYKIRPFDDRTANGIEFHLNPYSASYEYDLNLNERSRSTNIHNYLNDSRETMLEHVQKSRAEAHERYEMSMRDDDLKKFENDQIDELKRHLFTQHFLFLIRVDEIILGTNSSKLLNPSPYRLYLLVTDYFIDRHEQFLFGLISFNDFLFNFKKNFNL